MDLVRRNEVPVEAWDGFVRDHVDGWWFHTWTWIDYAVAYTPGAVDASTAYTIRGEVAAVVPLVLDAFGSPVYGGQLPVAPLSLAEVSIQKTINPRIRWAYRPGCEIDELPVDYVERKFGTNVVDLSVDESVLWRNLRKSYKSLINRAEERFRVETTSSCEIGVARKATELAQETHFCSAKRRTRPQRTWDLQALWVASGDGLLLIARENFDLVGFAYVIRWKDWAYYASGAALKDNVSHLLLWEAMKALKADGSTRYFEIGYVDENGSEKERNIAFFKSGFGGRLWEYPVAVHEEFA